MTLLESRAAGMSWWLWSIGTRQRDIGSYLAPAMVGFAASIIAWARIPAVARGTFWAEDGRTFVQAAIDSGPFDSIFQPYAGYLHVIPRSLASLTVALIPVSDWAHAMTAFSCAVAGLVAGVVYVCSADVVTWRPARISLAMLTVLTPLAAREVLGNAANLHSLLLWMVFWSLLYRPRRLSSAVGLSLVIVFATLTEIQTIFLLPVLLYRWRDRARWLPRAAFAAAVAVQLITTLVAPRTSFHVPPVDPASLAYGYLINAVMPSWVPISDIGPTLLVWGPWFGAALLAICLATGVLTFAWGTPAQRWAAVAVAVLSLLIWSASVSIDPAPFYDYSRMNSSRLAQPWLSRYGVIPGMLLLAELVIGLSVLRSRLRSGPGGRRRLLPAALLAAVMLSSVVLSAPGVTRRSAGPAWEPQAIGARESCESLSSRDSVTLRETLNWTVTVPCGRLEARSRVAGHRRANGGSGDEVGELHREPQFFARRSPDRST